VFSKGYIENKGLGIGSPSETNSVSRREGLWEAIDSKWPTQISQIELAALKRRRLASPKRKVGANQRIEKSGWTIFSVMLTGREVSEMRLRIA
jgi:hypothetical protein